MDLCRNSMNFEDSDNNEQPAAVESEVSLGFAEDIPQDKLYRLRSHYMPLGKVGGKPSWLSYYPLPTADQLACKRCGLARRFLLQVYAPRDGLAFHRSLFLFVCTDCCRPNHADNFIIFRCQLPRLNQFYPYDRPLDPSIDGDVEPSVSVEKFSNLCEICGCEATKKCARCQKFSYCSKEHQKLHWTWAHKGNCSSSSSDTAVSTYSNLFLFPEYGIDMAIESVSGEDLADGEDSDYQDDHDCEEDQLVEYRRFLRDNEQEHLAAGVITENDMNELEESEEDVKFEQFSRCIRRNPEQILRYQRGGTPLLATDKAPTAEGIPPCAVCGAERQFEFQLTPRLLSLLDIDSVAASLDWATVMIFTCSASCQLPQNGYAPEFVFKQDF